MKKFLGIDYGDKKIGLSIADYRSEVAVSFSILKNSADLWKNLKKIINSEEIDIVVVGMPLNMKGQETQQTKIVQQFCSNLKKQFPSLVIETNDERFTSKIAKRTLGKDDDAGAAVLILQNYLTASKPI